MSSSNDETHVVYVSKTEDILEALTNLVYLICEDASQPQKVMHYASMCQERLEAMRLLLEAHRTENIQNPRKTHPLSPPSPIPTSS